MSKLLDPKMLDKIKMNDKEISKKLVEEKAKEIKEKVKEKRLDALSTLLIVGYGFFVAFVLGIFFNSSGEISLAVVFDPFFIIRSIAIAILGVSGYILLVYLATIYAETLEKFLEAQKKKADKIEKIKDKRKNFKIHRLNVNHKNKIEAYKALIDYKLDSIRGLKNVIFFMIGQGRRTWKRKERQFTAYINYLALKVPVLDLEDPSEDQEASEEKIEEYNKARAKYEEEKAEYDLKLEQLLNDMDHFNLANVKVDHTEWTEDMFLISNVSTYGGSNAINKDETVKKLAKQKLKSKLLIWVFTTAVTIISVDSLKYGLEGIVGALFNLLFIIFACMTGWKDGIKEKLTGGINVLETHEGFVNDFLLEENKEPIKK